MGKFNIDDFNNISNDFLFDFSKFVTTVIFTISIYLIVIYLIINRN